MAEGNYERREKGCEALGKPTSSPSYQLLESDGQATGAIGELRTSSENRRRTVRKPAPFACFVVEREDGYLSSDVVANIIP